ncbi:NTP transferase domain-containing protein [Metallosphaera tengchongensis]|uniref:NTP transferase domain-containing protein n=1 Tax=Metallosphaera tengchongensis TaxID=1532350 RepID=A0A6N0NUY1_9CREN|nr:NTP transferase domain-containing protein [Metallosphaera tengchongensis]QKQ99652.1 NTP transferase domain-containing protein [Metallosphaera tengchongensis]
MSRDLFDVIVLAGGSSSRFGADKCDFEIDGQTMLDRVTSNFLNPIIVTSKERRVSKGVQILDPDRRGPLAGVAKAIQFLEKPKVFITGCDFPFLKRSLVELICSKPELVSTTITCGKIQPLLSCYSTQFLVSRLRSSPSLTDVVYSSPSVYVVGTREIGMVDPSLKSLINVNRITDLYSQRSKLFWHSSILSNTKSFFVL